MSNYNMNYRKSQSVFIRNEVRKKALNSNVNGLRGGTRL